MKTVYHSAMNFIITLAVLGGILFGSVTMTIIIFATAHPQTSQPIFILETNTIDPNTGTMTWHRQKIKNGDTITVNNLPFYVMVGFEDKAKFPNPQFFYFRSQSPIQYPDFIYKP